MRVLVIGGTGHIGSYLVPRLVRAGHTVTVVARHTRPQYTDARLSWGAVQWIKADRRAEEHGQGWAERMRRIDTDAVMDLICYSPAQQETMLAAFRGRIRHFLHCGTIWAYGPSARVPYRECYPRRPIGQYGRDKVTIEAALEAAWRREGFPATIIHPGHISGRRWLPIDPQGSRAGVGVYERLAAGQTVQLPDTGLATLHHVHGDDVAQLFQLALEQPGRSLGESFSAVAPYALSLRACAQCVAGFLGRTPQLEYVPLDRMRDYVGEDSYQIIQDHVLHSPCSSIEKGQQLLGYQPRYTTEQIYEECLEQLLAEGQLKVG
jgi:nucleoside-diphosphate-sugar epimerase